MSNKKFYWLKLKEDFFDEDTISYIEEQENGIVYSNFYLKLCLKSLKNEGKLIRIVGDTLIPYDAKSLSKLTGVKTDTVKVAMDLFLKIGLIQILDSGEIYLSQINEMIGSETDKAILMRKKRAKEKLIKQSNSNNVTGLLPECYTEKEIEKEIEKKKDIDIDVAMNEGKEKTPTYKSIVKKYTDNEMLLEALNGFVEMRKKMKGFTTRALELALVKLDKLGTTTEEKTAIVNQSVMNGWKAFYPLKDKQYPQQQKTKKGDGSEYAEFD